ncbi:MAG: glutathione S-transferase family protein [Parvibaculum sp.]|uniref:glutathione S-transferase family protein n=1 Tax=Parvibaculum sp. TaxID=2024848 RepID=UPI002ABC2D21|nr:glutathione S-transferase family protein [Parvibaculum sp.]MDZ4382587.1 glutathione S-transferase family protein [Parvibaculum sp.]
MRQLYHLPISPACRKVRLVMAEKGLDFELVEERDWERRDEFLMLNPAGEVPVLLVEEGEPVSGATPIAEYLEETAPDVKLLPEEPLARAEVRRLVDWFDRKFAAEVSDGLIFEKVTRRFLSAADGGGAPDMIVVRAALHNLRYHLDYICYLMEERNWLAGEALTLADLTAAAHLSCLDYVGDVPWAQYQGAKDWYVRIKSRPGFRGILADHVAGMPPPKLYANLDF